MTSTIDSPTLHRPDPREVVRTIGKRSYCTLATVSPAGRPHVAGVLYELVDDRMYINTTITSRKARNLEHSPHVAVVIPVRRVPVGGPPSAVQFQSTATVLSVDDLGVTRLVDSGKLASITAHGELDLPGSCFIRIDLPLRLRTYGLGMSLFSLVRDPLGAAGVVEFSQRTAREI